MTNNCPRFDRCGASLCPLKMEGRHLDGEAICEYLRKAAKGCELPESVAATIHSNMPAVIAANGDIRRRLAKAAATPERGGNLRRSIDATLVHPETQGDLL
jgi:hypothetical protein